MTADEYLDRAMADLRRRVEHYLLIYRLRRAVEKIEAMIREGLKDSDIGG